MYFPLQKTSLSNMCRTKKQASREELNHIWSTCSKTKSKVHCKPNTQKRLQKVHSPVSTTTQGLHRSAQDFRWSCWLNWASSSARLVAAQHPGITQLPACLEVGWRSWGVSMITHFYLRVSSHGHQMYTKCPQGECGFLWHELLQGSKFADEKNSAGVRLPFKSAVVAVKPRWDAFG